MRGAARRGAHLAAKTRTLGLLCLLLGALLFSGCGTGSNSADPAASADPTASANPAATADPQRGVRTVAACSNATLAALAGIAEHIYAEAANGRIVAQAILRLQRSSALANAVERADPRATRRILYRLRESQIVRMQVTRGIRVLADIGNRNAIAPTTIVLRDAAGDEIGKVRLSVEGANGFAHTVKSFVGPQVLLLDGPRRLAETIAVPRRRATRLPIRGSLRYRGVSYRTDSFIAHDFSGAPLRVVLLLPTAALPPCGATAAETATNAIGRVAMRIYAGELQGPRVSAIVHHVERSPAFRSAVLSDNPKAARAAIVGFFRSHQHVVRVRALLGDRLVRDLGGPFVLAPVEGALRGPRGHVRGHFLLAVQDDMGYMLLTSKFTGAQVLMRVGSRQVMSTLWPGPAAIPDRGAVFYAGVNYQAFSFIGRAFPSGPLRISLLIPQG
jgi:hypothetical protein